jgi:predicted TIM-barrel fold metal-dependent hydrolase
MIIDFETHFLTKEYVSAFEHAKSYPRFETYEDGRMFFVYDKRLGLKSPRGAHLTEMTVCEKRLGDMNAAGIDMHVLSLSAPGCDGAKPKLGLKLARTANDYVASLMAKYPQRFLGLSTVYAPDPESAAEELRRAVSSLGLNGLNLYSNVRGEYLDSERFWPIFREAERLDVPVLIHPTLTPIRQINELGFAFWGPSFGYDVDPALSYMRMIFKGVFDKFPRLKIVLGHLGEIIPFLIRRIDFPFTHSYAKDDSLRNLKGKPSDYVKRNLYADSSGNPHQPSLTLTCRTLGAARVVFASDYPNEQLTSAVDFIRDSELAPEEQEMILWKNAARLLKLK